MFTTPTVFILGAGASWHYSYPTGEDLVKDVIETAKNIINTIEELKNYQTQNELCKRHYRNIENLKYVKENLKDIVAPEERRNNFLTECKTLVSRLNQINPPVIDYFLGENEDLQAIGKLIISWVILSYEAAQGNRREHGGNNNANRKRHLIDSPYHDDNKKAEQLNISKFKDDWYRFIVYRLTLGCKNIDDFISKNNVSFITFNYDVSLEYTLQECLNSITMLTTDGKKHVNDFFNGDRFLHVYGQIRKDALSKPKNLRYSFKPFELEKMEWLHESLDEAYLSSKELRTIYPHKIDNSSKEAIAAKKKIAEAKDVFILGYGFDENNNEILGLHEHLNISQNDHKRIFFTNYKDRQSINKRASKIFFNDSSRFYPGDRHLIKNHRASQAEKSTRDVYEAIEQDFDFSDVDGKA